MAVYSQISLNAELIRSLYNGLSSSSKADILDTL
jgi:hypothetical protein